MSIQRAAITAATLLCILQWAPISAQAIMMHDSVPSSEYEAHGDLFPWVGFVSRPDFGGGGALIGSRWVLTARC